MREKISPRPSGPLGEVCKLLYKKGDNKSMKSYKSNAIIVGALFIITMLFGMVDSYFVSPKLNVPLDQLYSIRNLILLGVFSVFAMAIGIVGIAIYLYPVVKKQSEVIAVTYLSFRIIECVLLIIGPIAYLFLIAVSKVNIDSNFLAGISSKFVPSIAFKLKDYAFQLSMILLGINSLFLCYSFYQSKIIPRFLSIWGFIGYVLLFLSALFDILGLIDTTNGMGALMYIPGGLWELIVFPIWLFAKGFKILSDKP